jgi:hypothetical protein
MCTSGFALLNSLSGHLIPHKTCVYKTGVGSACATTRIDYRSEQQHSDSLLSLVRADNIEGIKEYFKKFGQCRDNNGKDATLLFMACPNDKLYLDYQSSNLQHFLAGVENEKKAFQSELSKCQALKLPMGLECRAKISSKNLYFSMKEWRVPFCYASKEQSPSSCHWRDESKFLFVERPEKWGENVWLAEKDLIQLRELFVNESNTLNTENIKKMKEKKEVDEKIEKQQQASEKEWDKSNCFILSNATLKQKLSSRTYLIYTPCFGFDINTNECNLFSGVMYNDTLPAILTTKKEYRSKGALPFLYAVKRGKKSIRMDDGFKQVVPVFEESDHCEDLSHNYLH